jgi:hypothetical protein
MGFIDSLRYAIGWRRSSEKLGIRIDYSQEKVSSGLELFEAQASIGYGKPGKTFITSPEIRELLARRDLKGTYSKSYFGKIWGYYREKKCELEIMHYFPVPQIGLAKTGEPFQGKGIAERIESRFEEEFRKKFPEVKTIRHTAQNARIEQLKKRGLIILEIERRYPYERGYQYERYRQTLRAKVANDLRKARAKRSIKPRLHAAKK